MSTPNPYAFPVSNDASNNGQEGMSLRDYFAAKAMAAMLSNPASYDINGAWRNEISTVSEEAYEIADDMLEARARK